VFGMPLESAPRRARDRSGRQSRETGVMPRNSNVGDRYAVPGTLGTLADHAKRLGPRWRLKPPFLEHLSQAFARFFMRVGLPSTIPEFR
jgi:hypothetical protein